MFDLRTRIPFLFSLATLAGAAAFVGSPPEKRCSETDGHVCDTPTTTGVDADDALAYLQVVRTAKQTDHPLTKTRVVDSTQASLDDLRSSLTRRGRWLPQSPKKTLPLIQKYLKAAMADTAPLDPAVQDFLDWVEDTSLQTMAFQKAIVQSNLLPFAPQPPMFTTIQELFRGINYIVTKVSPAFDDPTTDGLVGCPLNALLDYMMWTPSGAALFRDNDVNLRFNRVLNVWSKFLDGPDSREFLTDESPHGWYCKEAQAWVNMSEYIVELPNSSYKYSSWNAFFTRKLKPGLRPVASPDDSKVITSGCESTPNAIQPNSLTASAMFWLKNQPYSLPDIFTQDDKLAGTNTSELVRSFDGGSVYQAFLSATNYHCWHSPVDGTIEHLYTVPGGIGTYYSELLREGFDEAGPDKSQGYLSSVAVRMIFIIKADDCALGRMAIVQIGMAEVSSVVALVKEGDQVKKGDLIGEFKFGGSTFLNIFQPGVIKKFLVEINSPVTLNTPIAIAN